MLLLEDVNGTHSEGILHTLDELKDIISWLHSIKAHLDVSLCTVCMYCMHLHTLHCMVQRILDTECTGGFHLVKKNSGSTSSLSSSG